MELRDLSKIRNEYRLGVLDERHMIPDPMEQFSLWMAQAVEARVEEPTAMALATVSDEGLPSARIVLLKGADADGLVFYTNYLSRKGRDLENNPHAALVFHWKELERQVRVEGPVEKVLEKVSDDYFAVRPEESKITAIVSPQSAVVPDRQYLMDLKEGYLEARRGRHVRPGHWGGYRLVPDKMEFWQGRPGRMHDRILYSRAGNTWKRVRLAP